MCCDILLEPGAKDTVRVVTFCPFLQCLGFTRTKDISVLIRVVELTWCLTFRYEPVKEW